MSSLPKDLDKNKHLFSFWAKKISDSLWQIHESEIFHLRKVLRLEKGHQVRVMDGLGKEAFGEIEPINHGEILVKTFCENFVPSPLSYPALALGILDGKGKIWEDLLSMCSELGIKAFYLLSLPGTSPSRLQQDRWERILIQSSKQAKLLHKPSVQVLNFKDFLEKVLPLYPQKYVGIPCSNIPFPDFPLIKTSRIFIAGPEKGFSSQEESALLAAGCQPCTFGQNVLRSKTAALVGSMWLQRWIQ